MLLYSALGMLFLCGRCWWLFLLVWHVRVCFGFFFGGALIGPRYRQPVLFRVFWGQTPPNSHFSFLKFRIDNPPEPRGTQFTCSGKKSNICDENEVPRGKGTKNHTSHQHSFAAISGFAPCLSTVCKCQIKNSEW